jgi:hypothetical protein
MLRLKGRPRNLDRDALCAVGASNFVANTLCKLCAQVVSSGIKVFNVNLVEHYSFGEHTSFFTVALSALETMM